MTSVVSDSLGTRYTRSTTIAAVLIAWSWHLLNDGAAVVINRSGYQWPVADIGLWWLYVAVLAVASVDVLRTGRVRHPWVVVAISLAISASVAVDAHGQIATFANWGWGAVGWLGVLACWGRPLTPLLVLAGVNVAINGAILVVVGSPDRTTATLMVTTAFGMYALQVGFVVGARALTTAADWAVRAATARVETEALRVAAEQTHLVRQQRYEWLQQSAAQVLDGLAAGVSDPADSRVQRRCAIEAARLRRLFLETEDVPNPLLHEIRGCADVAERRGVIVDLRSVGHCPVVPVEVRRALTEPLILMLSYVASQARVTLTATEDMVSLSVLAMVEPDTQIVLPTPDPVTGIEIQHQREEHALWVETRWLSRSR